MTDRKTYFADIILPLAVPQYYTYRVPMELNESIAIGMRAIVQFGKARLYTGIVRKIHEVAPAHYEAKYMEGLLDDRAIVTEGQMQFWEWMAGYYCCTVGEVFVAALPGSLRLASETKIVLLSEESEESLSPKEQVILDALSARGTLTLAEVSELLHQKNVQPYIKSLIEKNRIAVEEELKFRYKPKYETVLELHDAYQDEENLKSLFAQLENDKRAIKRVDALLKFIQLSGKYSAKEIPVKKSELIQQLEGNASPIETLIKNGILIPRKVRVDRLALDLGESSPMPVLSEEQQSALDQINHHFENKETVLLHGVTGSGKTEIYVKLIDQVLKSGQGPVLYLLPEIALTTQIINRLRRFFGDVVGVYHSRFNEQERAEIWTKTLKGEYKILIGARSSLFLPFRDLQLVIIDEEHENSFKQYDPSPRYQARDSAIVLAMMNKAKTLLGSATPSIESYYNALQDKYGLVVLKKRFGGMLLPEIQCIDLKKSHQRKEMHESFSHDLLEFIRTAIGNKEQVILFQNRRGYTPQWKCETCGWVPKCKNCDVSLTYHKHSHSLQCHYCNLNMSPPKVCSACGSHKLNMLGFGTEKIEEDLVQFIPGIRVQRLDLDTSRSKNAYLQLLSDFEDHKIDVLVGTQMVTKGLDFDNVALVGVLNADSLLNFPDFRAFERSFQLLAQVSGRSGRKNKRGLVQIQTWEPNHWVIQKVMQNDYEGLYKQEIIERRNFHYPPFIKLIRITIRHKDRLKAAEGADALAKTLRKEMGKRILGPEKPVISRIRNYYIRNITIKIEKGSTYPLWKKHLMDVILDFRKINDKGKYLVDIDVDPA